MGSRRRRERWWRGRKIMAKLYILLDSSTRPKETKYGESIAAWAAWWEKSDKSRPTRCAINYFIHEGPNATFYHGVITSLLQCKDLVNHYDQVFLFGDCDLVIKQLNNEWSHDKLTNYYNRVKKIENNFPCKINYKYINEENKIYKSIDQLSKQSLDYIKKKLNIPKI